MEAQDELRRFRELAATFCQLNRSLDVGTVLHDSLDAAVRLMGADSGSIALIDDRGEELYFAEATGSVAETLKQFRVPVGEGIVGHVFQHRQAVRVEDAASDARFYRKVDEGLGQRTGSYLSVPLLVDGVAIGTAQVLNHVTSRRFSASDEELMEGFASLIALAVQNARLHEAMLEKKAIETELDVCAAIQLNLLPSQQPTIDGFDVHGTSRPCRQVGGDYLTYVHRPDGSWILLLADVSGKGLPAALVVSELSAGVHLMAALDLPPAELIQALNRHLTRSLLTKQFVTLVALVVRPGDPRVEYVVAGHPPPFVVGADGELRRFQSSGPVLGVLDMPYQCHSERLGPGETLVTFSDGYSEASGSDEVEFGEAEIAQFVAARKGEPLAAIQQAIDEHLEQFREGAPSADDDTLLLVRHH